MLHPSYSDLMKAVNADVEPGEEPVVNSRYSIVMATAKRARQLVAGSKPMVFAKDRKPLSVAVDEIGGGHVRILTEAAIPEEAYPEEVPEQDNVLLEEDFVTAGEEEFLPSEE